jgi:hypothetical protein
MANDYANTKVVTGKVRLSYAHIWEPKAIDEGQEPKYSVSIIIPKNDKATIKKIKEAIKNASERGKADKFGGKVPANLKTPLRDGDEERPDDDAYADSYFLNASSRTRPGVVDKNLNKVLDQDEVYSGCYARVSINFYPFAVSGNKGIAAGLGNIQKVADGEPLGGRTSPENDFGDDFEFGDEEDDDDDFL